MSDKPEVELKRVGERPGRPPLSYLLYDLTLRNHAAGPRWFKLPSRFGVKAPTADAGVDGVEAERLLGSGRVVVGRFQGTGGFLAIRVAALGEIHLRGLSIASMGPPGPHIEVVIARGITVGGEPAESWFAEDPTSDVHAEVDAQRPQHLKARHTADRREVPIVVDEERRVLVPAGTSPFPR